MTIQTKGRAGGHQETPNTPQSITKTTGIVYRVKAVITTLAVWGWFPIGLAHWIVHSRMWGDEE